jgi:SNF family Na+-dependent transporter
VLVEGMVSIIDDSSYNILSKCALVATICTIGFLCSQLYTRDAALHFLDVIDFYVNFIILFAGFCKSFLAGWIYGLGKQMKSLGCSLVYAYLESTFSLLLLVSLV